ncbi:MAG TPA: hypothetical protein VN282_00460 [Pyrinomonadaceae bacterium]|nr:hypothetical protein [Pyrinomonadaceae bacterium]
MRQVVSRLLLSATLLTLFAATAFPQKRLCPKPPPSPFKHDGEIVTSFDSRAGGMRTSLQHPRAIAGGAELFYLAASFMHQSTKRPGTPALELVLYTTAPSAQPRDVGGVSLVLDGRARPFTQNASLRSRPGGGDAVRLTLSYADLAALTLSRSAAVQLGGAQLQLTNNHLESLRELQSLLAPSPGRWQTADAQAR